MAEGELQPGQDMLGSTYARGLRYSAPGAIEISGSRHDADTNLIDWVTVDVPATGTGTFQIDASGCPSWELEGEPPQVSITGGKFDVKLSSGSR